MRGGLQESPVWNRSLFNGFLSILTVITLLVSILAFHPSLRRVPEG